MDTDCEIYQHLTQTVHAMERAELLCRADAGLAHRTGAQVHALHAAATRAKLDFTRAGEPPLREDLEQLEQALMAACEHCDAQSAGLEAALHEALQEVRDLRRQLHGDEPEAAARAG